MDLGLLNFDECINIVIGEGDGKFIRSLACDFPKNSGKWGDKPVITAEGAAPWYWQSQF